MKISIALHVIGLVLWFGALILGTRAVVLTSTDGARPAPKLLNMVALYITIGFIVAFCSGFYQTLAVGWDIYKLHGWFHTKLTLAALVTVLSILSTVHLRALRADPTTPVKRGLLMATHGIAALVLIVNIFLSVANGLFMIG